MPQLTYNTVGEVLNKEQKEMLAKALTKAVTDTLGERLKSNIWVTINEAPEGNLYIGGNAITAEMIKGAMNK